MTPPIPPLLWSQERLGVLKELWNEGYPASRCAAILGGGITRNSVISAVHRYKLSDRPPVARAAYRQRHVPPALATKRKKVGAIMDRVPPPTEAEIEYLRGSAWEPLPGSLSLSLLELSEHTCKWPEGESNFTFCGLPVLAVSDKREPYCPVHHKRAHPRVAT